MAGKSILIIEDDSDIRLNASEALEIEGYTVLQAANGVEALSVLEKLGNRDLPGLILLDLMMPEMDGKTFLKTIKENHADTWAMIPVVIATAKGSPVSPEQISVTIERIKKPMDLDDLYQVVKKYCGS